MRKDYEGEGGRVGVVCQQRTKGHNLNKQKFCSGSWLGVVKRWVVQAGILGIRRNPTRVASHFTAITTRLLIDIPFKNLWPQLGRIPSWPQLGMTEIKATGARLNNLINLEMCHKHNDNHKRSNNRRFHVFSWFSTGCSKAFTQFLETSKTVSYFRKNNSIILLLLLR